ncbi:uncharacterized protein LOC111623558 isoform X2 [Centruroides sculpturatus]|nr:uncharacterized protein LOC111623558 isoform X2 [Centruroides sculpturatus]
MYRISIEYQIENLRKQCRQCLINAISGENVCRIHDFACQQDDKLIQYYCWRTFDAHWKEVFNGDDFLRCQRTTIDRLLSRPVYLSLTEGNLFSAVYKWVTEEVKRGSASRDAFNERCRTAMEPFVSKIRFLSMSLNEFSRHVVPTNYLNDEEKESIRSGLTSNELTNYPERFSKLRDRRNRSLSTNWFRYLKRMPYTNNSKNKSMIFSTEISVMEDCFVITLKLPVTHYHSRTIPVKLNGYKNFVENRLESETVYCNEVGFVYLECPIFVGKDEILRLTIEFVPDEIRQLYKGPIMTFFQHDMFRTDYDSDAVRFLEYLQLQSDESNHIYFEVDLYF